MLRQSQHSQASHTASSLADLTITQISGYLTDLTHRAEQEEGDARALALDYVAELVTALRELRLWPTRRTNNSSLCQ